MHYSEAHTIIIGVGIDVEGQVIVFIPFICLFHDNQFNFVNVSFILSIQTNYFFPTSPERGCKMCECPGHI